MKIDILFLDSDLKGSEDFINDSSLFEEYCSTHSFEGKANQTIVMPPSYSKRENRTYLVGIGDIEANQELYELGINIGSKIKEDVEIDFLNIDIEGLELEVMSTINFNKFNVKVICIELLAYNQIQKKRSRVSERS